MSCIVRWHSLLAHAMRSAALLALLALPVGAQELFVRARTLHTMAGPIIADGVVHVRDGVITKVGHRSQIAIPSGARVLDAAEVTPGLIDAHSVVGLAGWLNVPHDQDQVERSAPMQPELRAIDAFHSREPLVGWVRSLGVTTLHTGHAPLALISGQTMIVKTRGRTAEEDSLRELAMIAGCLGDDARGEGGKGPGTRAKRVALLRQELLGAQAYLAAREKDPSKPRELKKEALALLLRRERPLLLTAHRANDILNALRLAQEFSLEIVLDGASEIAQVLPQVRAAGCGVILHPTMMRHRGETESASLETAALLHREGIRFALQSGYESYVPKTRVVLWEAAMAAAYGLPREAALAAITSDAARLLRIEARVGSLEVGKDADLALFDGDPFETTSHVIGVVIDGELVSEVVR